MSYYNIDELYQVEISPRDRYIIKNIYGIILVFFIMVFLHMIFLSFQKLE